MPDSLRKQRQRERRSPGDRLGDALRESISARDAVTIESNPAADFQTLGFNVRVPATTTDAEIVSLRNQLLDVATASRFAGDTSWTWLIGIYRSDQLVSVLQTGDTRSVLCPICGYVQQESMGSSCLSCAANLPT